MAIKYPDNTDPKHPKPVTETERKSVNGVYQDYDSVADVIETVPSVTFRKNKYFRIAGLHYFTENGVDFVPVNGELSATPFTNDPTIFAI